MKNIKILVLGKNGQLGRSLNYCVKKYNFENLFRFIQRSDCDMNDLNGVESFFEKQSFDLIINCAAYTFVDKAESEKSLADTTNHLALSKLAKISKKNKSRLIHISSDYVFNGESKIPYKETDETDPINFYGITKLEGEKVIQKTMLNNAIIIRAGWIYSEYGNNFVNTMLRLEKENPEINVVSDQIGSPTYAHDLAELIIKIITHKNYFSETKRTEIYHFSNKGEVSWYEFAKEIFKINGSNCQINPIKSEDYNTLAKRPKYSLLDKGKIINDFNIKLIDWRESLKKCLIK